jgi:hypothetical protein
MLLRQQARLVRSPRSRRHIFGGRDSSLCGEKSRPFSAGRMSTNVSKTARQLCIPTLSQSKYRRTSGHPALRARTSLRRLRPPTPTVSARCKVFTLEPSGQVTEFAVAQPHDHGYFARQCLLANERALLPLRPVRLGSDPGTNCHLKPQYGGPWAAFPVIRGRILQ